MLFVRIRKGRKALLLVVALMLVGAMPMPRAGADGAFFPRHNAWLRERERALINEVEQKAFILFQNGREDLFISPSYQGRTRDFAWVVPVPSRPQVSILKGAPFHELAAIAYPRGLAPSDKVAKLSRRAEAAAPVQLLERKTVGAYDVSVLQATDSRALVHWLDQNDYYLPPQAIAPMQAYVRERWTFVACRIKTPENAQGLATGTLAPLHLHFAAARPIYPMRLSAANPASFNLVVYVALPGDNAMYPYPDAPVRRQRIRRPQPQSQGLSIVRGPRGASGGETPWVTQFTPDPYGQPSLARVTRQRLSLYVERRTVQPDDSTDDYVWQVARRSIVLR